MRIKKSKKRIRLNPSEILNAETNLNGDKYTIIRRHQSNGSIMVAAVWVETGEVIGGMDKGAIEYVDSKEEVRRAVKSVNRSVDKFFTSGPMSWKSRKRGSEMDNRKIAKELIEVARLLTAGTFKCPDCGSKVLDNTKYCVKCKKKVKKASCVESLDRSIRSSEKRTIIAGDEWADDDTKDFANELANVMKSDYPVTRVSVHGNNEIDFTFSPNMFSQIPMTMTLTEFGHGGVSDSVNGMITAQHDHNFRVPGGFTRSRDPKKMWKRAKSNLVDIFEKALRESL